nr:uncharacterized protein LOC127347455 [Lolium perenne]
MDIVPPDWMPTSSPWPSHGRAALPATAKQRPRRPPRRPGRPRTVAASPRAPSAAPCLAASPRARRPPPRRGFCPPPAPWLARLVRVAETRRAHEAGRASPRQLRAGPGPATPRCRGRRPRGHGVATPMPRGAGAGRATPPRESAARARGLAAPRPIAGLAKPRGGSRLAAPRRCLVGWPRHDASASTPPRPCRASGRRRPEPAPSRAAPRAPEAAAAPAG